MSYAQKVEGLSGLFEGLDDVASAASGAPLEIALDAIEEDPDQPRTHFSERELDELAASIVQRGVRQAITVTPRGEGGRHRILYGARRFRAARRAGLSTIPAVIREPSPDDACQRAPLGSRPPAHGSTPPPHPGTEPLFHP